MYKYITQEFVTSTFFMEIFNTFS